MKMSVQTSARVRIYPRTPVPAGMDLRGCPTSVRTRVPAGAGPRGRGRAAMGGLNFLGFLL
jgi:hypothetical protein